MAAPPVSASGPIGVQRRGHRTAAFFDLDKTIIAKSSTLAFSRPFQAGGLINRRAVLRSAYAQFVYLVGGADHDQMERMRAYLSQLCAGWDVAHGQGHRRRDPAPPRRPDRLRRGGQPDRGAPPRRTRRGHRVHVRVRGGRADRRDARRRPGDRDPDGGRRTAGTPARSTTTPTPRPRPRRSSSWPRTRATTCRAATPTATRSPTCRCSRSVGHPHAVNPDKELRRVADRQGLAGPRLRQAGRPAAAGCASRPASRRSPRWPSEAWSSSAARSW